MVIQCVECDRYIKGRVEEALCGDCENEANAQEVVEKAVPQKLLCYFRKNIGHQCEEFYESKTKAAVKRRNQLRKHGYGASISKLGYTTVGGRQINLTLVLICAGEHGDTYGVPTMNLEVLNAKISLS